MNIFFFEWNSYGNEDIIPCFEAMGHKVYRLPFFDDKLKEEQIRELLSEQLQQVDCDFVFSFNYYPEISNCCEKIQIKYVSWVYDSPHIQVFSYTVLHSCNRIFLFDQALYEELHSAGITTVYYLPLAINRSRMEKLDADAPPGTKWEHQISFVGSMYSEKKHDLYSRFDGISEYAKGYLDGIMELQKNIYGVNILQDALNQDILDEMQKAYPTNPNASTVLSPKELYADYVLSRHVTAMERLEVMQRLGKLKLDKNRKQNGRHAVALYTHERGLRIDGVDNLGPLDYYESMPYVFRTSKINLNITLRSIRTGIPLRALDIMANGGFLMTNYQEELFQYFTPDEDFVYYTDMKDLENKVLYYLEHDDLRNQIAANGCSKTRELFDYTRQLNHMLDKL